eukprot:sb/3469597/
MGDRGSWERDREREIERDRERGGSPVRFIRKYIKVQNTVLSVESLCLCLYLSVSLSLCLSLQMSSSRLTPPVIAAVRYDTLDIYLLCINLCCYTVAANNSMNNTSINTTDTRDMIRIKDRAHFKKILTTISFERVLIVKFSSDWCGPCKSIGGFYNKLEKRFPMITFAVCDVDIAPIVAEDEGITCLPTIAGYKDGKKDDSFMGSSKEKLLEFCVKMSETEGTVNA